MAKIDLLVLLPLLVHVVWQEQMNQLLHVLGVDNLFSSANLCTNEHSNTPRL